MQGSNIRWWERLLHEIVIVIALGSVPVFITYGVGGADAVGTMLKASLPSSPLIAYLALLFFPYAFFTFVDHYLLKRTEQQKRVLYLLRVIWKELGSSLHALWRVSSGLLLSLPVLWYSLEPQTFDITRAWEMIWLGLGLLAQSCFFSWLLSYLEKRFRWSY